MSRLEEAQRAATQNHESEVSTLAKERDELNASLTASQQSSDQMKDAHDAAISEMTSRIADLEQTIVKNNEELSLLSVCSCVDLL